jgi:hypothetical protein
MDIEINPLTVLGARRLDFLPPHIEPILLSSTSAWNFKPIADWVDNNLKGRYFMGSILRLENDSLKSQEVIGFEDPKESTLFLLACPYLAKIKV